MLENIRQAIKGIWSHKMRSMLTMLGIIIGIAAIIAIVSTIKGENEEMQAALIGRGSNTVKVNLTSGGDEYYSDYGQQVTMPRITDAVLDKIRDLKEVEEVTAYTDKSISDGVYYKNQGVSELHINGIDDRFMYTNGLVVKMGRSFMKEDYVNYRPVLMMDEKAAQTLFKEENPLGKTVEISKFPFKVIGIVTKKDRSQLEIKSASDFYSDNSNGMLYMPKASWPVVFNYDEPEKVTIKATGTDTMVSGGKKTADILNALIPKTQSGTEVKYQAENLLDMAKSLQTANNSAKRQLIWIAGISLLVGGIGVMNIMLVSVTERTSEIGLKKAIGARKRTILAQFLTEAAVLTSLGGLLGVLSGIAAAQIIHEMNGTPVGIDVPAAVIAVGFSMFIGIVFGFLPSVQAANLDPIEALRRE